MPVSKQPPSISAPLSEDDLDKLAEFLDEHSPFDVDGLLGLLHAVCIAPSMMPPSTWIHVVAPEGVGGAHPRVAQESLMRMLRLYNEVLGALNTGAAIFPEPDDIEGCDSFAAGYIAGAELDPEWIGDDDRWTFASWAAYLSGKHDLVTPRHLVELEKNPVEARAMLRREMGAMLRSTHESFTELRRRMFTEAKAATSPTRSVRIGRNDPCPCGSGKKYKRCCVDMGPTTSH